MRSSQLDRARNGGGRRHQPGQLTEDLRVEEVIRRLLQYQRVAIVGLSDDPDRPSHEIGAYLLKNGYQIVPVYELLGKTRDQVMPQISSEERLTARIDNVAFSLFFVILNFIFPCITRPSIASVHCQVSMVA